MMRRMFAGLHDIDWTSMEHAYGPADEVPSLIEGLCSADQGVRERSLDRFYSAVHHQGDVYACTVASLPFLFELAEDVRSPGRGDVLRLLASIGQDAILWDYDMPERFEAAALMRIRRPTFLAWASDDDAEVRFESIGMLGYVLDDPAPLRGLLATARSRREQLQIVDAVGTLSGLLPQHAPQLVDWLAALTAGLSADSHPRRKTHASSLHEPELRLAATVERVCLLPGPAGDEVVPAAVTWLREIAGMSRQRRAETGWQVVHLVERLHTKLGDRVAERIQLLAEQLNSPALTPRLAALREIESLLGHARDRDRLVGLVAGQLAAPDHQVVAEAAAVLAKSARAAGPACEALAACVAVHGPQAWAADDPHVRRSHQEAVRALARLGDERAVPSLLVALDTGVDVPRAVALVISLPSAADVLLPRLGDYLGRLDLAAPDANTNGGVVLDALATLGDKAAIPLFADALDAAVRTGLSYMIRSALQGLRDFGPAAAPALDLVRTLAYRGEARTVAVGALWAISRDPDEAVPPLLQLLDDGGPEGIRTAAELLGEIGPAAAAALPALRRRLSDPYHWDRVHCAQALWVVGGEPDAPAVIATLVQTAAEEPVTTKHAVDCLTRLTVTASPALTRLRAELHQPAPTDSFTSITADDTLRQIARSLITQVDDEDRTMT